MRKKAFAIVTIFGLLLITWLPCQADDIYGCAKKMNGQLRIVSNPSKCLKSEYPITLFGTTTQNPIPNFKGELCWSFTGGFMKLWVWYIGGGHYLVSGKITTNGIVQNIFQGNAEIEGSNIYMTLVNSGKDSQAMWTGINHVILDGSTLNGTAEAIGHDRDYSEQPFVSGDIFIDSDTQYGSRSVTFIACP